MLVHGPAHDPARVTTADDLPRPRPALRADAGDDIAAPGRAASRSFIRTEALCPPLARLLDVRRVVGLRNSGHTVAKLLRPCAGAATLARRQLHPSRLRRRCWPASSPHTAADAVLMRGTEGEPVADRVARRNGSTSIIAGVPRADLSRAAQEGVLHRAAGAAAQPRRGDDGASTSSRSSAARSRRRRRCDARSTCLAHADARARATPEARRGGDRSAEPP